ncbi:hypothetical protein PR002_g8529 [Phytophthora rubi]|uniref:Uncharacterized protein n=1 Tax=Phytophthora rubi TaxID=129364 RepID=A0A6A3MX06_9STRA|nr:hypothetical protein PR002_g8529 [Phytophthora rubi]
MAPYYGADCIGQPIVSRRQTLLVRKESCCEASTPSNNAKLGISAVCSTYQNLRCARSQENATLQLQNKSPQEKRCNSTADKGDPSLRHARPYQTSFRRPRNLLLKIMLT